jgi:hypothetical protein
MCVGSEIAEQLKRRDPKLKKSFQGAFASNGSDNEIGKTILETNKHGQDANSEQRRSVCIHTEVVFKNKKPA